MSLENDLTMTYDSIWLVFYISVEFNEVIISSFGTNHFIAGRETSSGCKKNKKTTQNIIWGDVSLFTSCLCLFDLYTESLKNLHSNQKKEKHNNRGEPVNTLTF